MDTDAESIKLGGNIELSGFRELDSGSMIILKKIIGNYVRRFSDQSAKFEGIRIVLKPVFTSNLEKPSRFEVQGKLFDNGKMYSANHSDNNVFVTIDRVLGKIERSLMR
ncbi:MAG: hypothetical protein KAT43_05475 [Nanoarchaeota archaeon]|nr:hypothetical protein [Nanoarchaeota archaeon]